MPLFYFVLKAGRRTYPDSDGQEFPDQMAAREHAHAVARELMRNRETRTSHWRVQVCNDYLEPCYECLFADVDHTLERYDSNLRTSVAAVARTTAALGDALRGIDAGMTDLRQILNRMDFIISSRPLQ
ncbi:hypothetical protein CQ12_19455 [Bradyrhizobium jicamae]|uniref:DUF6894 domain-containing protein n=1 Tax=Bradyrhizobium jicamae TaxID=280332 RepID=A0A0R3LRN2_9BRAD|nr:hypothetical protein [Bradyrhizobium jicamae]KRR10647.1 hypothetical protein CQ12_19455 [Bradyrhizobium jicamae]